MMYLQESWGYVVMIGGLFVTLVVLMILDGPARRRDLLRRQDEHQRAEEIRQLRTVEAASLQDHPSQPKDPGTTAK